MSNLETASEYEEAEAKLAEALKEAEEQAAAESSAGGDGSSPNETVVFSDND